MEEFIGYHSEWNLGSPGGWDYQRLTQVIGKAVWDRIDQISPFNLALNFEHPYFRPVGGVVDLLVQAHYTRSGRNPGLIAVIAEAETLADVVENRNLAKMLDAVDGITGVLAAPQELELKNGRVCWQGQPVSVIFMDFNTDVLLALHRKHDLSPAIQAVKEHRVINPRGTEPFNVKSMFELLTGPAGRRFHPEIVRRTPWTRRFFERQTEGPDGEPIDDLIGWTHRNWDRLVLKPERGYSGHGVRVGTANENADDAIEQAIEAGDYIVQEKIPLSVWSENIPHLNNDKIELENCQTDFRCLMGPGGLLGFVGRYGGVPTNVGSGGGFQPLAVFSSDISVQDAVDRINENFMGLNAGDLQQVIEEQKQMAMDFDFTYLLGPVKIALRPRVISDGQIGALTRYGQKMWDDCLKLEQMWRSGELDDLIRIEEEELEIARMNPWQGSPAVIASDGLFGFGAQVRSNAHPR
ncbi:MAG: hypothetical protein QNJ58_20960 [Desulfobacterales bacterium]|nr:hypothetical protein [Desulfobacterales bacterium]